ERIVLALPDIHARLMFRPALSHQNRSRIHKLPAKALHAQPLPVRVPPVRRRPAALLMCHDSFPLFLCYPDDPAEPVAQVRFVDLRLFSRRTPQLIPSVATQHFYSTRVWYAGSRREDRRPIASRLLRAMNLSSLLVRAGNPPM